MNDPIFILLVVLVTISLAIRIVGEVMISYFDDVLDSRNYKNDHDEDGV